MEFPCVCPCTPSFAPFKVAQLWHCQSPVRFQFTPTAHHPFQTPSFFKPKYILHYAFVLIVNDSSTCFPVAYVHMYVCMNRFIYIDSIRTYVCRFIHNCVRVFLRICILQLSTDTYIYICIYHCICVLFLFVSNCAAIQHKSNFCPLLVSDNNCTQTRHM